ncbi:hypothetical protein SAMN02745181_3237 [Rubritalea squalenifaciens DSM 18772]|uniref:DUF3108 domain-containing protein n=1 Tax=Rubritalea squalenifaciens DSM 18772 TaxID=1123071 RepID=A0A1M6PMN6_9BACT|nr:hypothetical protein [Rubritalea squalenifaciens]SHK09160.1 hypothetical protein SAMN02745181_3237 [Rubritalea squalenifaciens DSM 18772]
MKMLLLPALATLIFSLGAQAQLAKNPHWHKSVSYTLSSTVKNPYSEYGEATLYVELYEPTDAELEKIKNHKGQTVGYKLKGQKLPSRFWKGETLIRKFELTWDGKKIDIPERFWADLAGFRLQQSSLKLEDVPDDQKPYARGFLSHLNKPKIHISADRGTVLIEWTRSEECDGHSRLHWVISKSGKVLRHRTMAPHN